MAMIVVQSLTNSFGEMFIAANVIVMRVDGFAMILIMVETSRYSSADMESPSPRKTPLNIL